MNKITEATKVPLTVYGLLARRHGVKDEDYVGRIVRGDRRAVRGKAAAILADWLKLKDNFDDWMTEYKADGAMIVNMEDIHVSVYVQNGISRVYKRCELMSECDVSRMSLADFKDYLNGVRIECN